MRVFLMHRDRDFDLEQQLPSHEETLVQDLELNTLLNAMAGEDAFHLRVARHAILTGLNTDLETVLYRQEILKDSLNHDSIVKCLYDLAFDAIECKKRQWLGVFMRYPSSILAGSVELLSMLVERLAKLKKIADVHSHRFESQGFKSLFSSVKVELSESYLETIQYHLKQLKFDHGVLLSAELGEGNQGTNRLLRKSLTEPGWIERVLHLGPPSYTFQLHPRDEAGGQILSEMKDHAINSVANALAQSADHVMSFFIALKTELAFYQGCARLHQQLMRKGESICFPIPSHPGNLKHSCVELRDVCLILTLGQRVVGNELGADNKKLVLITGANQGGKSTFLRAIGLAQLMMQCGMFVTAESFSADLCGAVFTHYKREEDTTMASGKFDEELTRMNAIVDALLPNSLLLLNESFAATNEREGSEIAHQIIRALSESKVKIFFVTHLYEFAHSLWQEKLNSVLFLRAERDPDGHRTFKLLPGEPLQTSFGIDLYNEVFGASSK